MFVPGLELAEGFYRDAVKPILDDNFPGLKYSAALIGQGSEVLGFDTPTSTDHHWGPRVMLFLAPADFVEYREKIRAVLAEKLPPLYRGYSTSFTAPDPADNGVQIMRPAAGPVNHRVETFTISGYFTDYLGIDIDKELDAIDWLTLPQQKLRSIVAGKVFHDVLNLEKVRRKFAWYPPDVWRFILASLWARIAEEEHLAGRAGEAGDEVGSDIIALRLVRDIMRLALVMAQQYPPYAKWLGAAFKQTAGSVELYPVLEEIVHGKSWRERDKYLAKAYTVIAEIHNALGITEPVPANPVPFFGRPFTVIKGYNFMTALLEPIKAPWLTPVLRRSPIGSLDVLTDNTDLLEDPLFRPALKELFKANLPNS